MRPPIRREGDGRQRLGVHDVGDDLRRREVARGHRLRRRRDTQNERDGDAESDENDRFSHEPPPPKRMIKEEGAAA